MKKLAVLFALLIPLQSIGNICPILNSTEPGLADGCTTNPGGDGVGDYGYIFPYVGIFKSTFTGACNNHDKCYATLGADYAGCDQNFYSDLRSACLSKYNPLLRPAEYSTCMHSADLYYAGVSAWRANHPEEAVNHQRNALGAAVTWAAGSTSRPAAPRPSSARCIRAA